MQELIRPVPSLLPTWRSPRFMQARHLGRTLRKHHATPESVRHKKQLLRPLKLFASVLMTSLVALSYIGYIRFDTLAHSVVATVASSTLQRPLRFSRIARCNPLTGVSLVNVSLPPTADNPTAPVLSAARVDITPKGFLAALAFRHPLKFDVTLHGAYIRVSQYVLNRGSEPTIGVWDPGLPSSVGSAKNSSQASVLSKLPSGLNPFLSRIQPGVLFLRNSHVVLQPAAFQDYGHGDEPVHIKNVSARVTFPIFAVDKSRDNSLTMRGDFHATAKGTPIDGGSIAVQCRLKGDTLYDLRPDDVIVNLHVSGSSVRAAPVASFLSLPFRADEGRCTADIDMDFLYKSDSLVPVMRGEASLDSVGLRFHPDPKTPGFRNINGKLRFDGKTLIFDEPVGDLGSLPMTVVGNIHLEDGYDLTGYARPVDINKVLDTFEVDQFVPVNGLVKGKARMIGTLDEPIVSGRVESTSDEVLFDRLPLEFAQLIFEWDSVAGMLSFPQITAKAKDGGLVSGAGSMFFDMTKDNPWDIKQEKHSERSPKAQYWNAGPDSFIELPPTPSDPIEIDDFAPFRQYDSMRFDFQVSELDGGKLLEYFGGDYGAKAAKSVGLVSGEVVIAGDLEDANCRVLWRSVGDPPEIFLSQNRSGRGNPSQENVNQNNQSNESNLAKPNSPPNKTSLESLQGRDNPLSRAIIDPRSRLGGGSFKGLVHLKLGDPPEARRVKARTIVENFDARRAGWVDPELRKFLALSPLLESNTDFFFKGFMFQRPVIPQGSATLPRTPEMELLGMDGALAVKTFAVNKAKYDSIMSGSFSFSTSDFSMSLREVRLDDETEADQWEPNPEPQIDDQKNDFQDRANELMISASVKGEGKFLYRNGNQEIAASLVTDEQKGQKLTLSSSNFVLQDIFGPHPRDGGEAITGIVNANLNLNLTSKLGEGNIVVDRPGFGPLRFSSVAGNFLWKDRIISLRSGKVKYWRSEYRIDADYELHGKGGEDFGWEVNVGIPRSDVRDVIQLIRTGNIVATAFQSETEGENAILPFYTDGPVWLQKLLQSCEQSQTMVEWDVLQDVHLLQRVRWLHESNGGDLKKSTRKKLNKIQLKGEKDLPAVQGDISGTLALKYNSGSGEIRQGTTSGKALLHAILDQLTRTSFSFLLVGKDWKVGDVPLEGISARGTYEDGVLTAGPFSLTGEKGFGAEMEARVTRAGAVDGSVIVQNAPAQLVQKYTKAPVEVSGEYSGRLEVGGNLSNPRVLSRIVWTDAMLNGKDVHNACTDMACVNGRCMLNMNGRIGGRRRSEEQSDQQRLESLNWGRGVNEALNDLASKASTKHSIGGEANGRHEDKGAHREEDEVHIQVSAPVQFYVMNHLRRRASPSFWVQLEPVLGGVLPSDDEWIVLNIDVKKYGLIVLSTLVPEIGWEGGDCDLAMQVGGTLQKPVVSGRVNVLDGRFSPAVLGASVQSVRGELIMSDEGLLTLKSISGRCDGKWVSANGDIALSEDYTTKLEQGVAQLEEDLERIDSGGRGQKKMRRSVLTELNQTRGKLQNVRRGVSVDFRDIPLNVRKVIESKVSGRINVGGIVNNVNVGGSVTFSDGVVFLGNVGNVSKVNGGSTRRTQDSMAQLGGSKDRFNTGAPSAEAVNMSNFKVSLGRGMRLVQTFVANIEATGTVTVNGSGNTPDASGTIRLMKGKINAIASQMKLAQKENSYVRLLGQEEWSKAGYDGKPEALMKIVLEDDNVLVRVGECRLTGWTKHVQVVDKVRGTDIREKWDEELQSKDGEEVSGDVIKRMALNALLKMFSIGGRLGKVEWKAFPGLVGYTGSIRLGTYTANGEGRFSLKEEIGFGARIHLGNVAITAKRSVMTGAVQAKIQCKLGKWGAVQVGNEVDPHGSVRIDLFPSEWRRRREIKMTAKERKRREKLFVDEQLRLHSGENALSEMPRPGQELSINQLHNEGFDDAEK